VDLGALLALPKVSNSCNPERLGATVCLRWVSFVNSSVQRKGFAMRKLTFFQTVLAGARWVTISVAFGAIVVGQSIATGQEGKGKGGGGDGRASGGGKSGGGGSARVQSGGAQPRGGSGARVQGGQPRGNAGGGTRVQGGPPRANVGGSSRVPRGTTVPRGGAAVRTPSGGANVRTPSAGAGPRVGGEAGSGTRVPSGQPRPNVGGSSRVPGGANLPGGGVTARTPSGDSKVRTPSAGADPRVGGNNADAAVRGAPAGNRVGAGADARGRTQPGASSAVDNVLNRGQNDPAHTVRRVPTDDSRGRPGADATTRGDARIGLDGRTDTRGRSGADADTRGKAAMDAAARSRTGRGADGRDADGRGADGRGADGRGDARIGLDGRGDGRLDGRTDGRFDGRGDSRYSANWANRSRDDLRGVRNSMATAFGGNRDRGDFNGRARDNDFRDRDNDFRDRGRVNDGPDRDWRDRDRADHWNRWGGNVRSSFRWGPSPYYTSRWWSGRNLIGLGLGNYSIGSSNNWWGYQPWGNQYPRSYWWGRPRWNSFVTWFPTYGWNQPYYYDYGIGGNVIYRDNLVYVSGQEVGTAADYAASAADLAYIDPTTIEPTPADGWMPLGTFSVAVNQDEQNPPRVMQLAINQEGLISGTHYHRTTDKLYTVQGRVDQDTQRVAFTIGNDPNVVLETGLYNLTLDETPVLVHFDESRTATYLFVRLDEPAAQQAELPLTPGVEALR
jgi:hypothetical protein